MGPNRKINYSIILSYLCISGLCIPFNTVIMQQWVKMAVYWWRVDKGLQIIPDLRFRANKVAIFCRCNDSEWTQWGVRWNSGREIAFSLTGGVCCMQPVPFWSMCRSTAAAVFHVEEIHSTFLTFIHQRSLGWPWLTVTSPPCLFLHQRFSFISLRPLSDALLISAPVRQFYFNFGLTSLKFPKQRLNDKLDL